MGRLETGNAREWLRNFPPFTSYLQQVANGNGIKKCDPKWVDQDPWGSAIFEIVAIEQHRVSVAIGSHLACSKKQRKALIDEKSVNMVLVAFLTFLGARYPSMKGTWTPCQSTDGRDGRKCHHSPYRSWFLNSVADMEDLGRHKHCDERLFGPLVLRPEVEWEGEGEGGNPWKSNPHPLWISTPPADDQDGPTRNNSVRTCEACQFFSKKPTAGPSRRIQELEPLNMIGMDFLGPIKPQCSIGARYVLVVIDYFSRFIWAWATEGAGGSEVERFFEIVFFFMIFRSFGLFLNMGSGDFAEATSLLYQDKRGSLGYFERLPRPIEGGSSGLLETLLIGELLDILWIIDHSLKDLVHSFFINAYHWQLFQTLDWSKCGI
ncbi:uncharacterized protein N7518_001159 [Penicillium psychrosexuale]|uniref:uncharacterized protein n=1 Tax=Penicillium psychrosexuale TaxID=1002107 RepID=UPI002544E216|nr:uncharacterized protein N7518_001159 [Penicillium psychrosexuale]KAJ5799091.1 hypothetical protein N7518_001159 [Penicillium psychrosexuale]